MDQNEKNHKYNLFFGLQENQLKHISEVENGLKCNCVCPACEKKLVARNGGKKRVHHFAHYENIECKYGVQTSIHIAAKNILEEKLRIMVPEVSVFLNTEIEKLEFGGFISHGEYQILSSARNIEFDSVVLEKRLHKYIPDVIAKTRDKQMIIEIAVTHFVGRKKLDQIIESKISALEIDLSKIKNDFNYIDLEQLIIQGLENKKWLFNQFAQNEKKERQLKRLENIKNKNLHSATINKEKDREVWYTKYYKDVVERKTENGKVARHILNCPLMKRKFNGINYANLKIDCMNCEHSRGLRENELFLICIYDYDKYKKDKNEKFKNNYGLI